MTPSTFSFFPHNTELMHNETATRTQNTQIEHNLIEMRPTLVWRRVCGSSIVLGLE